MLLRVFFLASIFGWFLVNGFVPVPPIYRKAEVALKQRARAFISDQAIELALRQVNELDQQNQTRNAKTLRQVIYRITCKRTGKHCSSSYQQKINQPPSKLKQHIALALDKFFANEKSIDEDLIIADDQS